MPVMPVAKTEVAKARRRDSAKIPLAFASGSMVLLESGERTERCPCGAFAEGEKEVNESIEA